MAQQPNGTALKILDAALALVRERGYHALTMDQIAEEAGVSKGALYWHYESKKGLFLHLIDHWVGHIAEEIAGSLRETDDPREALRRLCSSFVRQFSEHPDVFEAETEFWSLSHRDAEAREKVEKVYGEFLALIEKVIREGAETGCFEVEDPHLAALTLLINLESCVWFTLFSPDGVDFSTYIHYFENQFLNTITPERRRA